MTDNQTPVPEAAGGVPTPVDPAEVPAQVPTVESAPAVEEEEPWPPREMSGGEALGGCLVLLALAAGALAYNWVPCDPELAMNYWRPSEMSVQRMDREAVMRQRAWQGEESVVVQMQEALAKMHAAQVRATNAAEAKAAELAYVEHVVAFVQQWGPEAYVGVGQILLASFQLHLAKLQESLSGYSGTMAEWMAEHADDASLAALRKLSGPFVERAIAAGLLGPGMPVDMDRLRVASVLWRGYWLQALGPDGPDRLLSTDEKLLLARFKAEASADLTDVRRLNIARYVEGPDEYPVDLVQGVLAARAGDLEMARASLERAYAAGGASYEARAWWTALIVRSGQFWAWQ